MLRRACPSCSLAHNRECPIIGASIMTSYAQLADVVSARGGGAAASILQRALPERG